jgi:hypothetical protein
MNARSMSGNRPLSITVIAAWMAVSPIGDLFQTIVGGVGLRWFGTAAGWTADQGFAALGIAVAWLFCAYGLWRGYRWSRVYCLLLNFTGLLIWGLSPGGGVLLPGLGALLLATVGYFLFTPAADRWFGAAEMPEASHETTP